MNLSNLQKYLIAAGVMIALLANPMTYFFIGIAMIDIQNLFGAGIDRQSLVLSTDDPFIQAMYFVMFGGVLLAFFSAFILRNKSKK